MLSAVFSFQGRLNRLQYFLGAVGLGVAEFVFVLVAGAGGEAEHRLAPVAIHDHP